VISSETRMMGLPYGEEIMIVGQTMWTQSTSVTDGRTGGQTDGRTELRSQRPCNAERCTVKMSNVSVTIVTLTLCLLFAASDGDDISGMKEFIVIDTRTFIRHHTGALQHTSTITSNAQLSSCQLPFLCPRMRFIAPKNG